MTIYVILLSNARLLLFSCVEAMGRRGKELSPYLKRVAVDLFRNGEKISDIGRILQQPRSTISGLSEDFKTLGQ